MADIIDFQSAKNKLVEDEAQEFVNSVLSDDNKLITFLANSFIDYEKKGKPRSGKKMIEVALKSKVEKLRKDITSKIEMLRK